MPTENSEKIVHLDLDIWHSGWPLEFHQGILTYHEVNQQTDLQLKLFNLSEKTIVSASVAIRCLDEHLVPFGPVFEYSYPRLRAKLHTFFGSYQSILLFGCCPHAVDVTLRKVVFSDTMTMSWEDELAADPQVHDQDALPNTLDNPMAEYKVRMQMERAEWAAEMQRMKDLHDKEEMIEHEKRELERIESDKRWIRQLIWKLVLGGAGVLILIVIFIFYKSMLPDINYQQAMEYIAQGEDEKAMEMYDSIQDPKQLIEIEQGVLWIRAMDAIEQDQFSAAITFAKKLDDHAKGDTIVKSAIEGFMVINDFDAASASLRYIKNQEVKDEMAYRIVHAYFSNGEEVLGIAVARELGVERQNAMVMSLVAPLLDEKEYAAAVRDALLMMDLEAKDTYLQDLFVRFRTEYESGDRNLALTGINAMWDYPGAQQWILGKWSGQHTVAVSNSNVAAVKKDGTVLATGNNDYGQCDVADWTGIVAVVNSYSHTVGLKKDGTVVAAGNNEDGQCNVSMWQDIVQIAVGNHHTVGLKRDGTLVATGLNDDGQCSISRSAGWDDIIFIHASGNATAGLKSDGAFVYVGENGLGKNLHPDWKDIVVVEMSDRHIVGMMRDGKVSAIVTNLYGQNVVSEWADIIDIQSNGQHTVGLRKDGTVVAAGHNGYNQCDLSSWKDIESIATGEYHTVGLKKDGTVVVAGYNHFGQCNVSTWKNVVAVYARSNITFALTKDGRLLSAGQDISNQVNVAGWKDLLVYDGSAEQAAADWTETSSG